MPSTILIASLVFLVALAAVYFALSKKLADLRGSQDIGAAKNDELKKNVSESLGTMLAQIAQANQSIGSLQSINQKIDSINNLFFSQKLRGNFGERVLQDMLEMNFPKSAFSLQHRFKDGQIVDAVLRTKDGLVPVDSKFPADNYRKMVAPEKSEEEKRFERNEFAKAVRKHITDIEKKYILPGEGTSDFAVMYVPSEAIFYEVLTFKNDEGVDGDLTGFASSKHVLMTSPNTMAYYLYIMKVGLERTRIEEDAQKVYALLAGLQQDFAKFGESLRTNWTHVTNAKKTIDALGNDFSQISGKIEQIKHLK
ncbi:MAG: DNA recombination protein RmuC [Patescibacteria group bacterium]